ncbi:MAG: prolipoprotein diacylglyceryl transferase [Bacteroidaceae bacterium]|nr:prolipoprotein diacylglyceryl transferase [Bacteroidaceae bacterium]
MNLLFIDWSPSIEAFHIGSLTVRWYSLFWALGLLSVYVLERYLYKKQGVDEKKFDPLLIYCFVGILAGARLGHCLFYEPGYYLGSWTHFLEMFLPFKITPDGWHYVGFEGLASHGGTLGLMIALWFYMRKTKLKLLFILDNIAIVTPICACAIRLGNLMNSEIIGRVSDVPWAFRFMQSGEALQTLGEDGMPLPRHPGQLYEAICYAIFFVVGWVIYKKSTKLQANKPASLQGGKALAPAGEQNARGINVGSGFYFGLCLTMIFVARFFIEFTKEVQGGVDNGSLPIDMGQILSIPFIILGVWSMVRAFKK